MLPCMNMLVKAVRIVEGPPGAVWHGDSPVNPHGIAAYWLTGQSPLARRRAAEQPVLQEEVDERVPAMISATVTTGKCSVGMLSRSGNTVR